MNVAGNLALALVGIVAIQEQDDSPVFRPEPDRHGVIVLPVDRADLRGERLRIAGCTPDDHVADWFSESEWVRWDFDIADPGRYLVVIDYAAPEGRGGASFEIAVAGQSRQGFVHATGASDRVLPQPMKGAIALEAGPQRLEVRADDAPAGYVMALHRVRLIPEEE